MNIEYYTVCILNLTTLTLTQEAFKKTWEEIFNFIGEENFEPTASTAKSE